MIFLGGNRRDERAVDFDVRSGSDIVFKGLHIRLLKEPSKVSVRTVRRIFLNTVNLRKQVF